MTVGQLLLIVGIVLLIFGIIFIIRKIGGEGNNKFKILGIEFETTNGTSALTLFLGFALVLTGAKMGGDTKPIPPGPDPMVDSTKARDGYAIGKALGEFAWYVYEYRVLKGYDIFSVKSVPTYESNVALATSKLKQLGIELDLRAFKFDVIVPPEGLVGDYNQVKSLINDKAGQTAAAAFELGYLTEILLWRTLEYKFKDIQPLGGYNMSIAGINETAKHLNIPTFDFKQTDFDSDDGYLYTDIRLHLADYMRELDHSWGRAKFRE
jgi:hypothetical protein